MDLLLFLVFGLVVGVLARVVVPKRTPGGWVTSIAVGMLGSVLGGFLAKILGIYGPGQPAGLFIAVMGAIVLLLGHDALRTSGAPT
jgi:uncharacterized membrane protein YeaQ/YmgE (transglycosylase-associated protein family)